VVLSSFFAPYALTTYILLCVCAMIQLRSLAADWLNGHEPRKDYRDYSRKVLSISILHEKVMICDGCVRH